MARKFQKPSSKKSKTNLINPPSKEDSHDGYVKFSFKYLITSNQNFCINNKSGEYFLKAIERFMLVCGMSCSELKYPKTKALRNHFIDWEDTTQDSFGLPNEEQLVDRPFQFGISANEHGRIIGFFIGNVFYIVWFDPDHNTYA